MDDRSATRMPLPASTRPLRARGVPLQALRPFLLALLSSWLSYEAAGASLGEFFGTFLILTLAGPPVWSGRNGRDLLIDVASTIFGTAIVWIISTGSPNVFLGDVLRCLPLLAAYFLSLAAGHALLVRCRLPVLGAAAITTVIGLLWLSWPVWLSATLEGPHGQRIVSVLAPVDPLIAVNGVMRHFGAWDHVSPLAYNVLTVLNQDVSYRLPDSVLPAVFFHGLVAALFYGIACFVGSGRPGSLQSDVR